MAIKINGNKIINDSYEWDGHNLNPNADAAYDLGTSDNEWKDLWITGTANIDILSATELGAPLNHMHQPNYQVNLQSGNIAVGVDIWKNPVITLTGQVTGAGTMTKLGSVSFVATIPDNTIDAGHLSANSVTEAKMAPNSVSSQAYVDGSIYASHIGDSQVTKAKMASNSIDSAQYVNYSIDADHLASNSVTQLKLADNSVSYEHIVNNSVMAEHLANNSVTVSSMAANSVGTQQYIDGSIAGAHIGQYQINSDHIVSYSINLTHMAANSINSDQYLNGSIDPEHLSSTLLQSFTSIENRLTALEGN